MPLDIDPSALMVPRSYGVQGQPHDLWTKMRAESPVHYCEIDGFENFWAITKHADIIDVSGKPMTFSNSEGPVLMSDEQLSQRDERMKSPLGQMRTIIEMDPPEHVDFRKVASGFFTPRSIKRLDEIVSQSARDIVDSLGGEGECDFIDKIGQRHPLRVLATILGIDESDEDRLLELTQQLFAAEDPDLQRKGEDRNAAMAELGLEFYQLFDRIIQDRRANPRDDLASLLANAKMANGEAMGPMETFGYYLIVFTAGHDTTRNAISGGMRAFMENPGQLEKLRDDPTLAKRAVEEVVRWTSPVNYMRRILLEDAEVRGQKIAKGQNLMLCYASANRDEEVFDKPFDFNIERAHNRHLGFGTGEHFCLGAHVARMSTRALFLELASRVDLMEPAAVPTQIESNFVVGLKTLPIRYKIRAAA